MPRTKKPTIVKINNVPNQGEEVYDAHARETVKALLAPVPDAPNLPYVTIVIITYKRLKEIQQTIDALLMYLQYPREKLHWLIADDSSGDEYISSIKQIERYKDLDLQFSVTPQNGGWGKNANTAIEAVETEYILFLEDDMVLTQSIDLRVGIALMEAKQHIGMLRLRGTAGDHVVLHQMEADISSIMPHYRDGLGLEGKLTYCLLDSGSPTVWIYSNGSHLRRKSFTDFYGKYPEGLKLGATEQSYAHTVRDGMKRENAPALAILPAHIPMIWDHIGASFQHTEFDKGDG